MRGVGDKAPALGLVGLQLLGQGVELTAEFADLIVSLHLMPVGIVAAGDDAHAAGEVVQTAQNHPREGQRQQQNQTADHQREHGDALAHGEQQAGQIPVVFVQRHRAAKSVRGRDGDGDAADEVRPGQGGLEGGLAVQGGFQVLRIEGAFAVVINRPAFRVEHGDPVEVAQIQRADDPGDLFLFQRDRSGQRRGNGRGLAGEGASLLLKHGPAGRGDGVEIQQEDQHQQDRRDEENELEADGMCHGIRRRAERGSDNTPRPTWSG